MNILVIDNFDSFTYNLVHYLEDLDCNIEVVRYDNFSLQIAKNYSNILISPGPGHINDYPLLFELLQKYYHCRSILGICLGHQLIASFFGYDVKQMTKVLHGKRIKINILNHDFLFSGISKSIFAGHYHSWCTVENKKSDLIVTSRSENQIVTSVKHKSYNIYGIQFHPESIMTEHGKKILKNWINIC